MQRLPLPRSTRDHIARSGRDFEIAFYSSATDRHPENTPALAELGHALTAAGRYAEGLAVDERLVRLEPDNPTTHYNLACSLALLERTDEAFAALERAVELGYDDPDHLAADPDLEGLRTDPRFEELVRRLASGGTPDAG